MLYLWHKFYLQKLILLIISPFSGSNAVASFSPFKFNTALEAFEVFWWETKVSYLDLPSHKLKYTSWNTQVKNTKWNIYFFITIVLKLFILLNDILQGRWLMCFFLKFISGRNITHFHKVVIHQVFDLKIIVFLCSILLYFSFLTVNRSTQSLVYAPILLYF